MEMETTTHLPFSFIIEEINCLPHTNYSLEFLFHRPNHIAMKIILWCKVVILP